MLDQLRAAELVKETITNLYTVGLLPQTIQDEIYDLHGETIEILDLMFPWVRYRFDGIISVVKFTD